MSAPDSRATFAAGFMDDYFAEAEEHVIAVRRGLLTLEGALGSELPPAVLEDLFRSCHSLKGISAMVELREAELLAHHMESCLRAIRQGDVVLSTRNFDILVDGARTLEGVIAAHRAGQSVPATDSVLAQLHALAGPAGGTSAAQAVPALALRLAATSPAPAPRWKVTFVPSPELVTRGVKVDTIRTRLLQLGHVVSVAPKVVSGGGVLFEFEVETAAEEQLAALRGDGIEYESLPAAVAVPEMSGESGLATRGADQAVGRPHDVPLAGSANFVRVDLERLDDLMRLVGDMVVTRARLEDTLQRVEPHVPFREWRALQEHSAGIERQLRGLREGVMRVRLVPVGEIFRRMPFVVRDLARDNGKRVRLDLVGQGTEIDKFLIERMMDPVIHLVRNAVSHAIETPEERVAAGKSPEGTVRLSASTAGESVVIESSDDGAGIDVEAVAARARASGMALADGEIDARTLLDIICASGFSTRDEADRASGRGVGMAVVRRTVEELGGALAVETRPRRGTTFRVTLPLTLAITDAIIVQVGAHTFAVPQAAVREVIEVEARALRSIERNELLTYRGATLPIVRLARLFALAAEVRPRFHAIVVGTGLAAVGFLVDRIAGQREIVVKAISDPLLRVEGISGATELGDGRLVLILDVAALSRALRGRAKQVEGISA
jgi:two-component system, chemotaxis family, sensor kinase CheA